MVWCQSSELESRLCGTFGLEAGVVRVEFAADPVAHGIVAVAEDYCVFHWITKLRLFTKRPLIEHFSNLALLFSPYATNTDGAPEL